LIAQYIGSKDDCISVCRRQWKGTYAITQDGVFATIVATVKSAAAAPITLLEVGAFADNDLVEISTTFVAGE